MTDQVIPLNIQPGIQRDGTLLDAIRYHDGLWCRFQRGRPRKIGGYNGIFLNASGVSRGMQMTSLNGLNYVVSGYSGGLQQWQTNTYDATGFGPSDYVLTQFVANANNLWQFDIGFDAGNGNGPTLVGHPGQNLSDITSTVNTQVLYGNFPGVFPGATMAGVKDTQGPTPTGADIMVSGGCVIIHPYLFVYGNDGLIQNSGPGNFQDWNSATSNANNVATGKIVKGLPIRGGTTSPSGLFWSTDALVRVSFSPTVSGDETLYWQYDLITSQSSIMSSSCVIEYDGIFYWCGVDRFLMYNGIVQEVPNDTNLNWFFDNLNYQQRQKVWVSKVPRWGEIWWFYPRGNATECTDAIIYNVREKTWYDAGQAVGAQRSAGVFSEVFRYPIWAGNQANTEGKFTLWQHEIGADQIYLNNTDAIRSYFETNNIGVITGGPGGNETAAANRWTRVERVEPDFNQSGPMSLIVTGRGYANDVNQESDPYDFDNTTLKIDMREQRRELRLRFESNTQGGKFETGKILMSVETSADERGTGNP